MPVTTAEQARTRLRARRKAPAPPPWRPPVLADFRQHRLVLAFDATLSHAGWVMFLIAAGGIRVIAKGMINPRTELKSYRETWAKAAELRRQLFDVPGAYSGDAGVFCSPHAVVVVEAPLAAQAGSRPESSLIAGMLVLWHYEPSNLTSVVSATHVAAVLLGDSRIKSAARKPGIRDAVIRLCPEAAGRDWNEHIRDALATGLTYLYDEEQAARRERGETP